MTLEALYYISQLIVAVVVIATLIAIWLQSRQTNRIAKAEFVHLILWEPRKPTPVEMQRKHAFLGVAFSNFEAAHNLHSRGLIEDHAYFAMRDSVRIYMQTPGARRYRNDWYSLRDLDPKFRAAIEDIAAKEEVFKDKIRA